MNEESNYLNEEGKTKAGKIIRKIIKLLKKGAIDNVDLFLEKLSNEELISLQEDVNEEAEKRGLNKPSVDAE